MTLVDVCGTCDTMFDVDEAHCRRCGADRRDAVQREMRDLCYTYTGDEPEDGEIARMVKPIFVPKWGKAQWYEMGGEGADDVGHPEDDGPEDDDHEEDDLEEDDER